MKGGNARLRTAKDRHKALTQYEEMRARGGVASAIVIVQRKDGDIEVLAQQMTPMEMGPLLYGAAEALAQAEGQRRIVRLVAHQEPVKRGEHNQQPRRKMEIVADAEGNLIPPKGENFISCGECSHPTWFVLHYDVTDTQSRMACAHCGNEVKNVPLAGTGHA
jgi:hypothetical protein